VLFDTGGIGVNTITFQMPSLAFSHLAAAGISGAEKKNFILVRHIDYSFYPAMFP
jgi:hypothetical protein